MIFCKKREWIWLAAVWVFAVDALSGESMEWIRIDADSRAFVLEPSGEKFTPWGLNYDRDAEGRLLEDYWVEEWSTVEADFDEMKELGANVVRIHLQLGRFMSAPAEPNEASLDRLGRLVELAERAGLYLNLTGLGCYRKSDVPEWYDALNESDRWAVQERFWEAVAKAGAASPAVFCYNLMNEPVLPGRVPETDWLTGELGGKFYVQRIALDLTGRTREEVAHEWVKRMTGAIRRHDQRRPITVGVIPWALVFPNAKPLFYSDEVGKQLDFVSVHFYPEQDRIDEALKALAVYDVGKPLVIEEIFPLKCDIDQLEEFISRSSTIADGWIGFYWGKTIEDYKTTPSGIAEALMLPWLEYFRGTSRRIQGER